MLKMKWSLYMVIWRQGGVVRLYVCQVVLGKGVPFHPCCSMCTWPMWGECSVKEMVLSSFFFPLFLSVQLYIFENYYYHFTLSFA